MLLLLVAGCAQGVAPYSHDQMIHLEPGDPAPFAGWLLSDGDLEVLVKHAAAAADDP